MSPGTAPGARFWRNGAVRGVCALPLEPGGVVCSLRGVVCSLREIVCSLRGISRSPRRIVCSLTEFIARATELLARSAERSNPSAVGSRNSAELFNPSAVGTNFPAERLNFPAERINGSAGRDDPPGSAARPTVLPTIQTAYPHDGPPFIQKPRISVRAFQTERPRAIVPFADLEQAQGKPMPLKETCMRSALRSCLILAVLAVCLCPLHLQAQETSAACQVGEASPLAGIFMAAASPAQPSKPIDPKIGLCGGAGQTCCSGRQCNQAGYACNANNICRVCGGSGNICCSDGSCSAGLACTGGRCASCGGVNQPCCASGQQCNQAGLACNPTNNTCTPCGYYGTYCCPYFPQCSEGTCQVPGICQP